MLEILEEAIDKVAGEVQEERWKIKSDADAEWWIEKKEEDLIEVRRFKMALENKIEILKEKLEKAKEKRNLLSRKGTLN